MNGSDATLLDKDKVEDVKRWFNHEENWRLEMQKATDWRSFLNNFPRNVMSDTTGNEATRHSGKIMVKLDKVDVELLKAAVASKPIKPTQSHTRRFVRTAYYIFLFLCTAGSLVIQILTLLSPTPSKITHLSFMKVISTNAMQANYTDIKVLDGPSAEFGLLGSCAWSSSTDDAQCTSRGFVPTYNFTLLGPHSPSYLISPPTAIPAVCLSIGIICTVTFICAYLLQCERGRVGRSKVGNRETLAMHSAILAFVFNLVAVIVVFMYMDKNIRDFNLRIKYEGPTNSNLQAVRGTAFVVCPLGVFLLFVPFVDELYRSLLIRGWG